VIRAAEAQVRTQEAVTEAISAQLRPSLLLSGSFSGREGGAPPALPRDAAQHGGWVPDVPNWDVALVLRIPIFDWVTWKRVDAARQREAVSRAEVDLVKQGQTAAVQRAWVGVDAARKAITALEREVEAALANSAQADARFRAGLATIVELTDAEALRTNAEIQLALGRFELARQRAILGRLIVEGT
jgi:outer membrane protein